MVSDFSCASTYYISNYGNDNNNGLSPVFAWKTIDKLNTVMNSIKPGDAVLFERGGYYIGQINLKTGGDKNNPIFISAYGKGKNPLISGAYSIKNWSVYKDKIYKAETDTIIKNLFVNREQMILARYPDKGLLTIKESHSNPNSGFTDSDLKQPAGYWEGSNVRIRTENWAYEYSKINKFSNGTLTFTDPTYYPALSGWGYYLDNNLGELNSEKEWFFGNYKNSKGTIYYFPPAGQNPESAFIECSIFGYGIYSFNEISNVEIRGLDFKNQTESGIYFSGNKSDIKIENCTFSGQIKTGMSLINYSLNCKIENCRFYNINGKAVYIENSKNTEISDNVFKNNGMIPGYGAMNDIFGMSGIIALGCDAIHIFNNIFENTGHDAINCIGNSALIERNVISNSLLLLNDGAAVKSYGEGNSNTEWKNNFVFSVKGNLDGTPAGKIIMASGMYLDAFCSNMKVVNNTITDCRLSAIYLYNENNNNLITGNVCYGNQAGIYFFKDINPMSNNTTSGNVFFGIDEKQYSVILRARNQGFIPGKFENNYYCNPLKSDLFLYQSGNLKTAYNFIGWQKLLGNNSDSNSKVISGQDIAFSKLMTNMTDDTSTVLLNPVYSYRGLNSESIHGSVTLPPWTSKIIVSNVNLNAQQELTIAGGKIIFDNTSEGNISATRWYKIFGNNLESSVSVNAPDGFEVSIDDNIGFEKNLVLYPEKGRIEKIIFVRFVPDAEKNYYDFVTNKSGSIKTDVKVSGNSR